MRSPLAPWRFILAAAAVIAAVPCGIAAAAPVSNGAELACVICVAGFLWAVWPALPHRPEEIPMGPYDYDDPKNPDYVDRLLDDADDHRA